MGESAQTGSGVERFSRLRHLFREEADMQTSEIYRQRAAECERIALKSPGEREQLKKVAQTWLLLAKAAEDLSGAESTLH